MAESGILRKSYDNDKFILEIEWGVSKTSNTNYTKTVTWSAYFVNNSDTSLTIGKGAITCKHFDSSEYEDMNSSMSRFFPAHSRTVIYRNALWETTKYDDVVDFDVYGKAMPSIDYVIRYQGNIEGKYYDSFRLADSIVLEPFDKIITATLSKDDIDIGQSMQITASYKPKCSYELTAKVNGLVETIATGESTSKGNNISWTVPESFSSVILSSSKMTSCTIECKTYDTATKTYIGSKSYMLTIHVPDSDKPEINVTVKAFSSITGNSLENINLAGVTYFKITNKCTAKNGAEIQSVNTTFYGQTYSGETVTTNVIPKTASGSIPITVKATDSRGLTNTAQPYVDITPYKIPKISDFAVHRCFADGTLDEEGDCCLVEYAFEVDALTENNIKRNSISSASIIVFKTNSKNPIEEISIDCKGKQTFSGSTVITDLDTEECFGIMITLYDKVTYIYETMPLSTAFTLFDIYKDGTGMSFGKVAEHPNLIEFDLPVQFNKNFMPTEEWINENTLTIINAYFGYNDYADLVGLEVDFENKKYTRLAGAVGLKAGADFDKFNMYGGRKRCNVGNNGVIKAFYGDATYSDTGTNGQVMVYQPKFYYRVVPIKIDKNENGLGYHIRKANYYVSSSPVQGFRLHPAFYDENGNEIDYILYAAYEGSLWSASISGYFKDGTMTDTALDSARDYICSESGTKPISGLYKSLTKTNFEKTANHRGKGWHCETIKTLSANQLLMMIELGTMNFQSAIGQGVVSVTSVGNYNCSSLTGATRSLGNATGNAPWTTNEIGGTQTTYYPSDTGKISVTYRGIENLWGNIYKHINGINVWGDGTMKGGQPYIADDFDFSETKHDDNYKPVGFTLPNENGYIKAMGYGSKEYDWLLMPSEVGGTSALPVGDYVNATADVNAHKVVMYGGMWNSASAAGGFTYYCSDGAGTKYKSFGGRIVYIPTVE